MCLHLLTIHAGQGDISEVLVFLETSKCFHSVISEVVPLKTKLFCHGLSMSKRSMILRMNISKLKKTDEKPHLGHHLRHILGIIWAMSGASSGACLEHVWDNIWGILSTMDNGQQWSTIRGATCVCDAVFLLLQSFPNRIQVFLHNQT